jgi:hypothetical protein
VSTVGKRSKPKGGSKITRKKDTEDLLIDALIERHSDTLQYIANTISCAKCRKHVQKPFYNLGKRYNWFEGCKKCSEEEKNA